MLAKLAKSTFDWAGLGKLFAQQPTNQMQSFARPNLARRFAAGISAGVVSYDTVVAHTKPKGNTPHRVARFLQEIALDVLLTDPTRCLDPHNKIFAAALSSDYISPEKDNQAQRVFNAAWEKDPKLAPGVADRIERARNGIVLMWPTGYVPLAYFTDTAGGALPSRFAERIVHADFDKTDFEPIEALFRSTPGLAADETRTRSRSAKR